MIKKFLFISTLLLSASLTHPNSVICFAMKCTSPLRDTGTCRSSMSISSVACSSYTELPEAADAVETGDRCGWAAYNGAWWWKSAIKPRCILPFIREWLLPERHSTHGHCHCINLQYQRQNYKSGKYWNIHFCKEMSCSYLDFFSQFHRQSSVCSIATYLWKIQRL